MAARMSPTKDLRMEVFGMAIMIRELDTLPDDGEHADHDSLGSASVATTEPEQTPDPVTVEDQTWFQKYKSCLM